MVVNKRPANANGPSVTIRFRSKAELEQIKRAARIEGHSLNTFVIVSATVKSAEILSQLTQGEQTA